jgi:hypothetical protein
MSATLKLTHKTIGVEIRPRHLRRRGRRKACRVPGTQRDHRHTGRTRTSHPANPQRPKLQPNQELRRRRRRNRRLPMQRKEHPADLPPVLRRPQPRTLAPSRVAAARRVRPSSDRPEMLAANLGLSRRHRVWRRNMPCRAKSRPFRFDVHRPAPRRAGSQPHHLGPCLGDSATFESRALVDQVIGIAKS